MHVFKLHRLLIRACHPSQNLAKAKDLSSKSSLYELVFLMKDEVLEPSIFDALYTVNELGGGWLSKER